MLQYYIQKQDKHVRSSARPPVRRSLVRCPLFRAFALPLVRQSACPFVRPSDCSMSAVRLLCPFVRPSVCPLVRLSAYPPVRSSASAVRPSVRPSACPLVCPSARPPVRLSACPPVRSSACLLVRLSARPPVRPSARPPVRLSARPSVRPSVFPQDKLCYIGDVAYDRRVLHRQAKWTVLVESPLPITNSCATSPYGVSCWRHRRSIPEPPSRGVSFSRGQQLTTLLSSLTATQRRNAFYHQLRMSDRI